MINQEITYVKLPLWITSQMWSTDKFKDKINERKTKQNKNPCLQWLLDLIRMFCIKSSGMDVKLPRKLDVVLFCVKLECEDYALV